MINQAMDAMEGIGKVFLINATRKHGKMFAWLPGQQV